MEERGAVPGERVEESMLLEQNLRESTPQDLMNSIPKIATDISSGDEGLEILTAKTILNLLEHGGAEATEAVIQHNNGFFVPHLLRLMKRRVSYAAKAVVVILRGTDNQAKVVMDNGGVASFAELLRVLDNDHLDHALIQQAMKGVEKIFSLSIEYRHAMVSLGAIPHLANILYRFAEDPWGGPESVHEMSYQILQYGASALNILFSAYPENTLNLHVETVLPILMKLINMYIEDFHVIVAYACTALHFLSQGSLARLLAIPGAQLCQRLVFLLRDSGNPLESALNFTLRIFSCPDAVVQVLVQRGVFQSLSYILSESLLEPHWLTVCSSIYVFTFFGDSSRVQTLLNADMITPLLRVSQSRSIEIRREAVCALTLIARRGSIHQLLFMVNRGCLIRICEHLDSDDEVTRGLCFEALWKILSLGEACKVGGVNIYAQSVSALGGFNKLHRLHNDAQFRDRVIQILMRYNKLNDHSGSNLQ